MESDHLPRGVKLNRNDLGGLAVEWNGILIGWIHASIGDRWNAYAHGRTAGDPGQLIGRYTKAEAIRRIALEAGWIEAEGPP